MGYALLNYDPDAVTIWCYCCEEFKPHTLYDGGEDYTTYYECLACGCTIDDQDEVIYPEDKQPDNVVDLKDCNCKQVA